MLPILQAMQSPMPCLPNLVSNPALYKKTAQSTDYKKLSEAMTVLTPHIGVLFGNPEDDRLIYRDVVSALAQNQRFLHPQFKDNPKLAADMRKKPSVASKNPWFDIYEYYVKKYDADHYKARLFLANTFRSFRTTNAQETKLYKKMLQDLEVPLRKEVVMIPFLQNLSGGAIGVAYNDQIEVHKYLPFEQLRSTLYHEGQHLKYHDSPKKILLQTLLNTASTFPATAGSLNVDDHSVIFKSYSASLEQRADHNTHHNHINCYKCNLSQAKFIKNEPAERTTEGYINHEELQEIAEKQKKQNLLCEHHRRWFFQNWFFDYLKK